MNKIGEGYYYHVYDLGNGRVLKKIKSKLRIFLFILFANRFRAHFIFEYKNVLASIKILKPLYVKILSRIKDASLLGNPMALEELSYEQDRVTPISQVIDEQNFRNIIDKYVNFIKLFWSFGLHENIYNFTINNGVDKNGNVVLLDFNEITFDIDRIEEQIKNKIWLQSYSYLHLPRNWQKYFSEKMDEEITKENLNNIWNIKR